MLMPYIQQGGVMMWPLLGCSVLLGASIIERCWSLTRYKLFPPRKRCKTCSPAAHDTSRTLPRAGLHPFFWEIPPQIGLLGTVVGLVQIFQGELSSEAFGRGVGVACLTTIFGIGIALVARTASYVLAGPHRCETPPATPAERSPA